MTTHWRDGVGQAEDLAVWEHTLHTPPSALKGR